MLLPDNFKIWLNNKPIDMRKAVNGLSIIVAENFSHSLQAGDLFIFYNKNRDRIKILYWQYNGFCLLQKKLERGIFRIPKLITSNIELNKNQLSRLFEGLYFINLKEKSYDIFY